MATMEDQLGPGSKQSSAELISESMSPNASIKIIRSPEPSMVVTTLVSKEIVKPITLKYPTLSNLPDVNPHDNEIMALSIPATLFKLGAAGKVKPLAIKSINRQRSLNARKHNTFYYAAMGPKGQTLVLRRGLSLRITLNLNRPILDNDVIFLEFKLKGVERSVFADGSFVRVKIERGNLTTPNNEFKWTAVCDLISGDGLTLHLQVRLADKTPLGHWSMRILATSENYDIILTPFRSQIYIIANPWGKDFRGAPDSLEVKRKEYVLSDVGLTFAGLAESPVSVPWRFGQFDQKVLEIAASLLKALPATYRSHLFKIVQHLSWMLHDERGIVIEKTNSAKQWAGSPEILYKYNKQEKPVAGSMCNHIAPCVFVTVCRALGIAARPVTFYNVLAENDGGLGVDRYYHTLGHLLHTENRNNMWCYKVMPEVHVHRPDLPRSFQPAGWQCVSHFGPCSVALIRTGPTCRGKPYGTDFVYRMTKAQNVNLKMANPITPIKVVPTRTVMMCNLIVTKAVASWKAENISSNYFEIKPPRNFPSAPQMKDFPTAVDATRYDVGVPKYYSGGVKKSHSLKHRSNESMFDKILKNHPSSGLSLIDVLKENGNSVSGFYFDQELDIKTELITSSNCWGEPVMASLVMKSELNSDSTASLHLEISSVSESGQLLSILKAHDKRIQLKPNVELIFTTQILFEEYAELLNPGDSLRVNANIHVEEEDYDDYFEKFIGFVPLNVAIKITNPESNNCEVTFSNVSNVVMKKCGLSLRELGSKSVTTLFKGLNLGPSSGVKASIGFTPQCSTGIYFIEALASCGGRTSSAYAALSFHHCPTLIPNLPSVSFSAIPSSLHI